MRYPKTLNISPFLWFRLSFMNFLSHCDSFLFISSVGILKQTQLNLFPTIIELLHIPHNIPVFNSICGGNKLSMKKLSSTGEISISKIKLLVLFQSFPIEPHP